MITRFSSGSQLGSAPSKFIARRFSAQSSSTPGATRERLFGTPIRTVPWSATTCPARTTWPTECECPCPLETRCDQWERRRDVCRGPESPVGRCSTSCAAMNRSTATKKTDRCGRVVRILSCRGLGTRADHPGPKLCARCFSHWPALRRQHASSCLREDRPVRSRSGVAVFRPAVG